MKKSGNVFSFILIIAVPLVLSQLTLLAPKVGMVIAAILANGIVNGPGGGVAALAIAVLVIAVVIGLLEGERAFSISLL